MTDSTTDLTVYWRPGCGFCMMLRRALDNAGVEATWINIWDDPEAAAFVRSVNNGNETVPTVRYGETVETNPRPKALIAALAA